jgi:hypothetical protein
LFGNVVSGAALLGISCFINTQADGSSSNLLSNQMQPNSSGLFNLPHRIAQKVM